MKRIDGQYGILTAGHVINAIKEKNIFVLTSQDRKNNPWFNIEGLGMEFEGKTEKGPDIGWIPLSWEEVKKFESLGAVFYNRAKLR